jgi:hypothetical protein
MEVASPVANAGHRMLIKNLLWKYLQEAYVKEHTPRGTSPSRTTRGRAQALADEPEMATRLRELASRACDLPQNKVADYILAEFTALLREYELARSFRDRLRVELRQDLQKILQKPDPDIIFTQIYIRVEALVDELLMKVTDEEFTPKQQKDYALLFKRIDTIIRSYHNSGTQFNIDDALVALVAEIGWTLCSLGATRSLLTEVRSLADKLYAELEKG